MMRALFPYTTLFRSLSDDLIALKIARHTPCDLCDDCPGLHPGSHVHIIRDGQPPENSLTDLDQYGSDEEDNGIAYLRLCGCGHSTKQHGANAAELGEEYTRRANQALHIDQHFEVRLPFWNPPLNAVCKYTYARCGVSTICRPFPPFFETFHAFPT